MSSVSSNSGPLPVDNFAARFVKRFRKALFRSARSREAFSAANHSASSVCAQRRASASNVSRSIRCCYVLLSATFGLVPAAFLESDCPKLHTSSTCAKSSRHSYWQPSWRSAIPKCRSKTQNQSSLAWCVRFEFFRTTVGCGARSSFIASTVHCVAWTEIDGARGSRFFSFSDSNRVRTLSLNTFDPKLSIYLTCQNLLSSSFCPSYFSPWSIFFRSRISLVATSRYAAERATLHNTTLVV